jgi:hypothetical protein
MLRAMRRILEIASLEAWKQHLDMGQRVLDVERCALDASLEVLHVDARILDPYTRISNACR